MAFSFIRALDKIHFHSLVYFRLVRTPPPLLSNYEPEFFFILIVWFTLASVAPPPPSPHKKSWLRACRDFSWCLTDSIFFSGMQGILQNVGNQKTARFPVYKTVQGFDIYLRFTAVKCTGSLLEITSRDTKEFLRVTLLEVGPIRVSFNTARGKGQLDVAMPSKGSFCDGKRHSFTLNVFQGRVFYNVDRSPHVRFYVSRLRAPFSSPDKIALGRGLQGCISGSTVINRFNRTEEHVMSMSAGCSVISE